MICPQCKQDVEKLTSDHIIPKWIYKRIPELGIKFKKDLGKKNIQKICERCNSKKSGRIDVSNDTARQFWTLVRDRLNKILEE